MQTFSTSVSTLLLDRRRGRGTTSATSRRVTWRVRGVGRREAGRREAGGERRAGRAGGRRR